MRGILQYSALVSALRASSTTLSIPSRVLSVTCSSIKSRIDSTRFPGAFASLPYVRPNPKRPVPCMTNRPDLTNRHHGSPQTSPTFLSIHELHGNKICSTLAFVWPFPSTVFMNPFLCLSNPALRSHFHQVAIRNLQRHLFQQLSPSATSSSSFHFDAAPILVSNLSLPYNAISSNNFTAPGLMLARAVYTADMLLPFSTHRSLHCPFSCTSNSVSRIHPYWEW